MGITQGLLPMPHRRHAAQHAPTPLTCSKVTKEEFVKFFSHDQDNKKIDAFLKLLPPPSPDEVRATGHFMGACNLACIDNEAAFLKKIGNDFKSIPSTVESILSGWCDDDSVYNGAKDEINDWLVSAAKMDAYSWHKWHHERLKVGIFPTYFTET